MLHPAAIFSSASNSKLHSLLSVCRPRSTHIGSLDNHRKTSAAGNGLLDFFDHLLQQCAIDVKQVKQIHSQITHISAASSSPFMAARLVSVYAKFGLLSDARKVFETIFKLDECRIRENMLLWNSMLRANVVQGKYEEAIELYCNMRKIGISPDGFGFPLIARACGNAMISQSSYKFSAIVHCHVVHMGFQDHIHVGNELLGMYGKIGEMDIACKIFDRMSVRTQISWNTMVTGFANNFDSENAYKIFSRMEFEGCHPNSITWTSLLSSFFKCGHHDEALKFYRMMRKKGIVVTAEALAVVVSLCAHMNAFHIGESVHGFVIKGGFYNCVFVVNSLICMYGRSGCKKEAEILFSGLECKNIVSWNGLISSFAESGLCDEALALFSQLEILQDGNLAMRPNVITWSAIIGGFAAMGRFEESLELFRQMQIAKVVFNFVTIASILTACAGLSALCAGKEIHAHVMRLLMDKNAVLGNGLINMYMKCGSPKEANLIFEGLDNKDLISWNTIIAGYGMLGFGENALKIFYRMINIGVKPDEVTFVAILSACSHAGLVVQGRKLFDEMRRDFRIDPKIEHYACLVDLLGRAGLVFDAIHIVKSMPIDPNAYVLGALLNSCKMYKDTDVAEDTATQIFNLDSNIASSYMLLSNLYAANGKWKDSAKVRLSAKTMGLKKSPGYSWIEVKKKVRTFLAGKAVDFEMKEVYQILNDLSLHMENEHYEFKVSSESKTAHAEKLFVQKSTSTSIVYQRSRGKDKEVSVCPRTTLVYNS